MNNRTVLTIFGLAVAAGVVALIVAVWRGADSGSSTAATPSTRTSVSDSSPSRRATQGATNKARVPPGLPTREPVSSEGATVAERPPTVYMTDGGVLVRDHRRNRDAPADTTGPRHAPRSAPTKMNTKTILAVRGALRPIVGACEAANSAAAPTAKTMQVVATVSVKHGELTVDAVEISKPAGLRAELGSIAACVKRKFTGVQLAAPDEPDVAGFEQTHRFRLKNADSSNLQR